MNNWQSIIISAMVPILLFLCPSTLRLSNRLALADERIEELQKAMAEERRRNDAQDQRHSNVEVMLARMEGKLDSVLQGLSQSRP